MYRKFSKRILDIFLSMIGLLLLSPVIIIAVIVLMIQNRGKVLFLQERPGINQIPFKIIKFKTMSDAQDEYGNLLPNNQRITKGGNIIRKLSIDEIPQLLNVLIGDMSLVGPRPLLYKYIKMYSKEQLRRHEVRPGITGWAQVNGRNSISWSQKFTFDIEYVDNMTFLMDMKILFLTVKKVMIREGINQDSDQPMQPFNGTN